VRQANLAPQLRRSAAVEEQTDTQPLRTPEQIRSIMSALQLGTTRGRIDASRYREEPPPSALGDVRRPPVEEDRHIAEDRPQAEEKVNGGPPGGVSFAEAATVSFPAIANPALDRDEASSGAAPGVVGDHAESPDETEVTRPEKDAQ
jgi:hypothetical protein